MNNYNTSINKTIIAFLFIGILGFTLRLAFADFGFMYDATGHRMNLDVFIHNGNIYDSGRYNYSPIGWLNITYLLDKIPFYLSNDFESLRIKITIFLSIIDFIIFVILRRLYSLKIGSLFYLNPISIYISGFHQQFGNVAILICFIGILIYEKYKNKTGFYLCSILIGLSLCIKHLMIFFPFWLAFKEKTWKNKILIILIPIFIFFISFINYYNEESFNKILNYVFKYSSFNNYPFWSIFTPQFLYNYIGAKNLYFIALMILGLFFQEKNIRETFYFYLVCLVTFSSGIANQYLALPLLALAVFWNRYYFVFTIVSFLFFLIDSNGLNVEYLRELINWSDKQNRIAYKIIIFFLTLGLLENIFGKKKFEKFFKEIFFWFYKKLKKQFISK